MVASTRQTPTHEKQAIGTADLSDYAEELKPAYRAHTSIECGKTKSASKMKSAAVDCPTTSTRHASTSCTTALQSLTAFVPYQLSDEMYAQILRDPAAFEYPILSPGMVQHPIFGQIYVEKRCPVARRPKLIDGYDWVPSSTASGSERVLRDGSTQLMRFYCARRTKAANLFDSRRFVPSYTTDRSSTPAESPLRPGTD